MRHRTPTERAVSNGARKRRKGGAARPCEGGEENVFRRRKSHKMKCLKTLPLPGESNKTKGGNEESFPS